MEVIEKNGSIILTMQDSFVLSQTLECGQCFRQEEIEKEHYRIPVFGKIAEVAQHENEIIFYNITLSEFEAIWVHYFDLKRDYNTIKFSLGQNDSILETAVAYAPGIRILNQDFFECLISFVISQNNRIPRIQKIIRTISERYGDLLGEIDGKRYFSFPCAKMLKNVTAEDFMACNAGFRGSYIVDAIRKVNDGIIDYDAFSQMKTAEVRDTLMNIKGVGPKVADCVLLFSCGRREVFPTDVWVKRIMSHFYFEGKTVSIEEIHKKAISNYGQLAGFAQQYLFHYARQCNIGK